jgi:aspartate racemase
MKRIGLAGGMTPESTKFYYETIIDCGREITEDPLLNPIVLIYSINLAEMVRFQNAGHTEGVVKLLSGVFAALQQAGAEIGALTANTPHVYFDAIAARTTLPLISILDSTFAQAQRLNCRRVLLLGTAITMDSPMYPEHFDAGGIEIIVPEPDEREFISRSIYGELSLGKVSKETRDSYLRICRRHLERGDIDAVILGCTEIPLVLAEGDLPVPLIDTARVHARAIFDAAAS